MTTTDARPTILIIDDEPQTVQALADALRARGEYEIEVHEPDDVAITEDLLRDSALILVDFQLKRWARATAPHPTDRVADGLALAAMIRRFLVGDEEAPPPPPQAIALVTGAFRRLAHPLPDENRQHTFSRLNNLEWIFLKANQDEALATQVSLLARAVSELPVRWTEESAMGELFRLLRVPHGAKAGASVEREILAAGPPIHEFATASHGVAFLRWMLHRILPYPTFLLDDFRLAARLGLTIDGLRAELGSATPLATFLAPARYDGVLAGFMGDRWWRPAVEHLLWESTGGRSFQSGPVTELLTRLCGRLPEFHGIEDPVVARNGDFESFRIVPLESAVPIRPDDWPPFADPAWTTQEMVEADQRLAALIIREDL